MALLSIRTILVVQKIEKMEDDSPKILNFAELLMQIRSGFSSSVTLDSVLVQQR